MRSRILPKPDALEAPDLRPDEYDRFSVAYGLSFDPSDIGEIIHMQEIEDFTGKVHDENNSYSVICNRCNGSGLNDNCPSCGGTGFSS